jgi:hypothetical protein
VTIEARDNREILRATGQFRTDARSYQQLLQIAGQWPERVWAVEGANGIGRPITQRLLASGERVLDVPAKLAARARVFDTGQGRKTDAADAHAIVMVALRDKGLREVSADPDLAVLRMLCDRRDELSRARAQALNRLHRLFLDLLPGGAPVKKSTSQYQALLARVRPRDLASKTRRRMAAEELEDLRRLDAKLKAIKAELKAAVEATGAAGWTSTASVRPAPPASSPTSATSPGSPTVTTSRRDRHRAHRRLQRPAPAPPALARRQPPPQPRALHSRDRPAAQRHPRPRLLPPQARCRENPHGSHALPAPPALRRGLPATRRRRPRPARNEPGRAPRGVLDIQRGRPFPGHRHFGSATSRTRTPDATATPARTTPHGPRSRHTPAARPRCQRGAPHRTNDVDTDQRRRTLNNGGGMPLTNPFIEGSHVSVGSRLNIRTLRWIHVTGVYAHT